MNHPLLRFLSAALTLLLLLFPFTACQNSDTSGAKPVETTTEPPEASVDSSESSVPTLDDEMELVTTEPGEDLTEIHKTLFYRTFEETLAEVTDIVLVTFEERTAQGITYQYKFSVTESIRGLEIGRNITVNVLPADCSMVDRDLVFSTYECPYQRNKQYLLLLKRSKNTYDKEDSFSFAEDSLIIQLNSSGCVMSSSSLYGEALKDHVQTSELRSAMQNKDFPKQLVPLVEGNPFYYGESYEGTADMQSVLLRSEFVFEITVNSVFMKTFDGTAITYSCKLDRIYKGETVHTEILVKFPHNNDIVGKSFIVAVNASEEGSDLYVMSSPYSIFDVSERDAIIQLIEAETQ